MFSALVTGWLKEVNWAKWLEKQLLGVSYDGNVGLVISCPSFEIKKN